jgi:hypothetical protein
MTSPIYVGRAWRARFLRAPKIALELAAHPAFVPLADLATARLGIKTGKDAFFFLKRSQDNSAKSRELITRRGVIAVEGMNQWRGDLLMRDVRPAVLNPHALFKTNGSRLFTIPSSTGTVYLSPRPGQLRAALGSYIRLGENTGVPRGKLVQSNASPDAWYRQMRSVVTSAWALPYNSAYDYGAWDNGGGAVLNGRFVGVDAKPDVDSDLIGAALNSTFALLGRLLEGVATGVEGALDVGPPAVHRIMLPDVRIFSKSARDAVQVVLAEIRRADEMPSAPSREGTVHPNRRDLDVALLCGLGLSKGEATGLLSQVYESYARWRADVRDVEMEMRENRKDMAHNGRSRDVSPTVRIAQRVWEEIQHDAPALPAALLTGADALESIRVPRGFGVSDNFALFDPGLIVGRGGLRADLGTFERVRYAGMLVELGFESPLLVPTDSDKANAIVDCVWQVRERVRRQARERALGYGGDGVVAEKVMALVEDHWHRRCRDEGMGDAAPRDGGTSVAPTLLAPMASKPQAHALSRPAKRKRALRPRRD